jgi:pyrroline-5-carboxylate reductase
MGTSLLRGWIANGVPPAAIEVIDPSPSPELLSIKRQHGIAINGDRCLQPNAEVIVLAVKPQTATLAVESIRSRTQSNPLIISIMAGKTITDLRTLFPDAGMVVRAMPNLASAVGRGMTVAIRDMPNYARHVKLAEDILSAVGHLEWLESEPLIDAATAVSGSGPAFVFYFAECLTLAGIRAGLPQAVAEQLSRKTIEGVGELLYRTDQPPLALRHAVTSPGGTTEAGLEILMASGQLQTLVDATVSAAARRSQVLSKL